ncbi:MAG: hypothetical protein QM676_05930 [Novosphingobium sp.]
MHSPFATAPASTTFTSTAFAALALLPSVAATAETVPASPPAAIDPCSLLTAAEVSAAMGLPVEPGKRSDNGITRDGANSTTCLWQVALPAGTAPDPTRSLGGRSFAILNVQNWPGGPNDARKFLEGFRSAFAHQAISSQPVDIAIGADEALWWGDGVAARKNGVSIGMSVAIAGQSEGRRPKAEGLARLIVQRLGKRPGQAADPG